MDELAQRVEVGVFDSVVDPRGTVVENLLVVPTRVFQETGAEGGLVVEVLDELAKIATLLDLQLVVEEPDQVYHRGKQHEFVLFEQ